MANEEPKASLLDKDGKRRIQSIVGMFLFCRQAVEPAVQFNFPFYMYAYTCVQ